MAIEKVTAKTPAEVVAYSIDWSSELASQDPADTILTSTWTASTGVALSGPVEANEETKITVSGGETGASYLITNKIVTDAGATYEKSLHLAVRAYR